MKIPQLFHVSQPIRIDELPLTMRMEIDIYNNYPGCVEILICFSCPYAEWMFCNVLSVPNCRDAQNKNQLASVFIENY